ncbi:Serine/threonine-protein phosphatase 6 regulatory ankyrin repeat subunit A like [Actinidia chinensis var. chinensis]|uniref:Serine/threonine-protein phosphatase 6 regulatory ankyrin repeat subunit A like n=1 Tax=Actinidia chinensis var. chinensis TaxID=1590841 RepID=A0A2R6RJF6_ACTCC|nr:Serine/threonine-protein phosphatase 6 regulatory ankyrin repeat subunit A like [Actinidia chinensis var. chinensis]
MPPSYLPLRWESTGDQWWYASPIDWAAANGHYDLVRELLHLDGNNLINLTSLRRIRRLETVWDDEEQFDDVAKCRSQVARKLFSECETKKEKNSLIRAGYGGWLLYTAASAGDLSFVQELLEKDPLLVFGEVEYGVTDILYAAARSRNSEVFRLVYDFAVSPRFLAGEGREVEEHIGEIPAAYKWEMMNRAVHAAARGGNLMALKELLGDCSDVLAFRDMQGSTILHAAAGRGQAKVVKYLIASFDIINSTDNHGNTALHVAAHRGQLAVVEALILGSPSSIYLRNAAGETFLHMVMSGFQTPSFHRLDRQIELMKQLVCGKLFAAEGVINAKNNDGRTALHVAVIGNVHSDLVEQLMSARSINVNIRDSNGMTPLDLIKQRPRSASSDILTRQLISAGGIFSSQDYTARRTIASHLRMRSIGSPGTSFRISDTEIFLHTGIDIALDASGMARPSLSTEVSQHFPTMETHDASKSAHKKTPSVNLAAQQLKRLFHWPKMKERKTERLKKMGNKNSASSLDETPIPLRQRFSKPSSLPNNKRTLSVRSNLPSPTAKKRFASGLVQGVIQAMPHLSVPRRSRSSSFSKSSVSSSSISLDKQKSVWIESDIAGPSSSNQISDEGTPNLINKQRSVNKSLMNQYLCFGGPSLSVKNQAGQQEPDQSLQGFCSISGLIN